MYTSPERVTWLAFLPIGATVGFYSLPLVWQSNVLIQFIPQMFAYLSLGVWSYYNRRRLAKLGLEATRVLLGMKWGTITGIVLGSLNAFIILFIMPTLGGDITFLRDTPHAQIPFWVMVPWFIFFIATAVELNFRGFLLGRLLELFSRHDRLLSLPLSKNLWLPFPLLLSALTFSFDPFMVSTFGALHWIALWDGLIWGWLWIRLKNLYSVIIAHAVEVLIVYLSVRTALL